MASPVVPGHIRERKRPGKTGTPEGTGIRKRCHCKRLRNGSHFGSTCRRWGEGQPSNFSTTRSMNSAATKIVATGPQGFLEIGVLKFIRIHTRAN